jgi:clan AA aspartic protease (TIGR02281 family)
VSEHFLLCLDCGAKNRIPANKIGVPKCGKCGNALQRPKRIGTWSVDPHKVILVTAGLSIWLWITYENLPVQMTAGSLTGTPSQDVTGLKPANVAEIRRGRANDFSVTGTVNGARVMLVVDTGASAVVLSHEAAVAAGLKVGELRYSADVSTANGRSAAARVMLDRITIGGITERSIPALVAQKGALSTSLLGMTFLNRLESWGVRGDKLIMRGRP